MKKVRIEMRKSKSPKTWAFVLYDSPESAFYLKDEQVDMHSDADDSSLDVIYKRVVSLNPGETLEIEWLGSEWAYDMSLEDAVSSNDLTASSRHEKYDKVRFGKLIPITKTTSRTEYSPAKAYLELYSGWVLYKDIPWTSRDKRKGLKITELNDNVLSKLDFSKLFLHKPEDDEDELDLPKKLPSLLN